MTDANLVGGSADDRRRLLQLHADYIDVNARFDWAGLEPIWSAAQEATFFNLNGHTYRGRDHWIRLWKFYGQNVRSSYWTPYDIGGVVSDSQAVIWCHRSTRRTWTGAEPPPADLHYDGTTFVTPLDHGVPQGGRRVARGPRPFLRGQRRRATRGRLRP